ncbi:3-hydroxyacyl-CoA dehydrogenase family protein [Advenella mimigardefordensis]|uniref:Putative NAD-binding 6-phosphopgluconate dehydrogenase n=1 Tax=Advenella mimigardefordensis (strain DSM 17166 / LMG 22922 / DPN7) TaxID=1247726 RepID=W0PBA0_ADVMD|nr:3-hydroxyacyl-CoA dehydrogenase family protein [Advenella mimigardefordensis]AHG64144.1 putative NAD-binding 6-phosphopgluconate dehydrogenase [Advenella mimigardefordensis DPN7]
MSYQIIERGESQSFPQSHPFLEAAQAQSQDRVLIGSDAGRAWVEHSEQFKNATFIAIELGIECLGEHIGEDDGPANVVGFARFRLGDAEPTNLVELVKKPYTDEAALAAARQAFEAAGLTVAVCNDFPGRILNRLVRPYYNAALRRLDEGLASAADMDKTLCLGLGYPEGPISLLNRTGLHHHYEVSKQLFDALGQEPYAPARRARVAWVRHQRGVSDQTADASNGSTHGATT